MHIIDKLLFDIQPNDRIQQLASFCDNSNLIIYGAGVTGKEVLRQLKGKGITPKFIVDDTPEKQGDFINGISIIHSNQLLNLEEEVAVIVAIINPSMDFHSFRKRLEKQGVDNVFSFIELSFVFPEDLLPYMHFTKKDEFVKDVDRIKKAYDLFDEESKVIFLKNLNFRLCLDFENLPLGDKEDYFSNSIITIKKESIFFDCGAFDGDTIKSFVSKNGEFSKVFAFEPDPVNFSSLLDYCAKLEKDVSSRVHLFNSGLSSKHSFLRFDSLNNMASSISSEGNTVIQTLNIDNSFFPLVKDHQSDILIKMDIEGEEPNALLGCEKLIKEKKAQLAISIYHNPDDLWNIVLMINKFNPNYHFSLKQHGNDSMDLVLYALNKN